MDSKFISFILWCIPYSFRIVFHLILHHLRLDCLHKKSSRVSIVADTSPPHPDVVGITSDDLGVVMRRLRLPHHEPFSRDSVENIADLFDGAEPMPDEVREAFRTFDENDDGFVDAAELGKVMSSLGFVGLSEEECKRMIMVFDDDGDGRISFGEFVKLIEESVCETS
ncbi:calmodulin-2/4-like [Salvia miltiorrhiza]|uniref:calmodulin-2/4-like n=1 Tax=Salvia miltiorrhiza TaxID=226208 RepID=UPI0025AD450E|nr:calmodulin-2/4-like [Salvia miltiorrhiza]